jgi:hypothetical protein
MDSNLQILLLILLSMFLTNEALNEDLFEQPTTKSLNKSNCDEKLTLNSTKNHLDKIDEETGSTIISIKCKCFLLTLFYHFPNLYPK